MTTMDPIPEIRHEYLGSIPLLMTYFDRLKIKEIVDQNVVAAPQATVSHGECVLALLTALFLGEHRLYQVDKRLEDLDLARLFGREGLTADQFHDQHLGWTLDALYGKTGTLYAAVISLAIQTFGLKIKRFHADFTTIVLYGAYSDAETLKDLHEPPIPVPARGFSKDHRPDLLQLVWGLVTTQEGIPLLGNFEDGNAAETELFRKNMTLLAGMLDDLRASNAVMIGDSKLCTIPTMAQAADLNMPVLTLIPETWGLRREAIEAALKHQDLPLLKITAEKEEYRGMSSQIPVQIEESGKPPRTTWLRLLAIHSTQLAKQKAETRIRASEKERERLDKWARRMSKREFACEADARKVLLDEWKTAKAQFHTMDAVPVQEERLETRARGRPTQGTVPKAHVVWMVKPILSVLDLHPQEGLDPEGFFVLLTTVMDHRRMSDADMLEFYKDQKTVEIGFHWLKGPMALSPIFLKKPERIQALGLIFLLALLVGALIQRDLRKALQKRGGSVAYFGRKRTEKPTWNSALVIFSAIRATWVRVGETWNRVLHLFDPDHQEILDLLGIPNAYENSDHVYS